MCERAGLFEPMDLLDYSLLTEDTFDWDLWIQQESRRRFAKLGVPGLQFSMLTSAKARL